MTENSPISEWDKAKKRIQEEYVDKVLGFIASNGTNKFVSNAEFMNIYNYLMYLND